MAAVFDAAKVSKGVDVSSTTSGAPTQSLLFHDSRCGECEDAVATWECEDCSEIYCDDCKELVHSKGRRKKHEQFVKIHLCSMCTVMAAKMECLDCGEYYCTQCCTQVHAATTPQASHKYIKPINTAGFKIVDLNIHNGFQIQVPGLVLSRLRGKDGELLPHVQATSYFNKEIAAWCMEKESRFHEPDPVVLGPPEEETLSSISLSIKLRPEDIETAKARHRERHERNIQRRKDTDGILSKIRSWRRLPRTTSYPTLFEKGNDLLRPRPRGVKTRKDDVVTLAKFEKGLFDDRWYLLAAFLASTNRTTFSNLFASVEHREVGMYSFQFYKPGEFLGEGEGWKCVTIDDLVPCAAATTDADGHLVYTDAETATTSLLPIFGITEAKNELWNVLLEKAYAKFLGSYSLLHRGDTSEALTHLTAGKCLVEQWDPESIDEQSMATLWWRVKQNARLGLLQAVLKAPDKDNYGLGKVEMVKRPDGMFLEWRDGDAVIITAELSPQQLHEMQVRSNRIQEGAKLIKIANLLGADEWTGEWSHTSPLWKPVVREYVNYKVMDECITWMKLADFAQQYNTLLTCTQFHGSPYSFHGELHQTTDDKVRYNADQYFLSVSIAQGNSGEVSHDEDSYEEPTVPVLVMVNQLDKGGHTFSYTGGALHPVEVEVSIVRVGGRMLVQPKPVEHVGVDLDEWDTDTKAAVLQRDRWPDTGEELQSVECDDPFETRYLCSLTAGEYVVCINQRDVDYKVGMKYYVGFFNCNDEDGRTSAPFPTTQKNVWSTKRKPLPAKIEVECIGSLASPRIAIPKKRPKTPRETVQERIEQSRVTSPDLNGGGLHTS